MRRSACGRPTGGRAAICIHLGSTASQEHQERLATQYCVQHHIEPTTLVYHPADALKLVKDGLVDTVVCAFVPAERAGLADEVTAAGGRLMEARERPRARLEVGNLFARLFDKGLSVAEIAELTEEQTGEIRAELLKRGRRDK